MSKLSQRKRKAVFETDGAIRGRPLVVELTPPLAFIREKGRRARYEISWEGIYWLAIKAKADRDRREKMMNGGSKGNRRKEF